MKNKLFVLISLPLLLGGCSNADEINRSVVLPERDIAPCQYLEFKEYQEGYSVKLNKSHQNTTVVIPAIYNDKPVVRIDEYAFQECYFLETLYLPNTIRTIGLSAFVNCTALRKINIPFSVTYIEEGAFDGVQDCAMMFGRSSFLKDEYIALVHWSNNIAFNSIDYAFDQNYVYAIKRVNGERFVSIAKVLGDKETYNLPSSINYYGTKLMINEITHNAFRGHEESLKEVHIPLSIKSIEKEAFLDCSNLKTLNIPTSVNYIGKDVFKGCSSLEIKCDFSEQPITWDKDFNPDNCPISYKIK